MGDGDCEDANGQTFDYCFSSYHGYTFEDCLVLTEDTENAIGFGFYEQPDTEFAICLVYFDKKVTESDDFDCPEALFPSLGNTGTGPIVGSSGREFVTCYACK